MFTLTEQDLVTKFKHNPVPIANAFYLINRKRRAKARRWQAKRTRQIMHDRKTTRPSKALPKPLCKKKITALGVNW